MKAKNGFSLIEFIVVILISGLTVIALFDMLNSGFEHYNFVNEDSFKKQCMGNIRVFLRNKICFMKSSENEFPKIESSELAKYAGLKSNAFINELKLTKHGNNGYFVKVTVCYDKNRNKKAEKDECDEQLMFFRRRT